jgi:hypothetical protein
MICTLLSAVIKMIKLWSLRWAELVLRTEEMRIVRKSEGDSPNRKPRRLWVSFSRTVRH